MDLDDYRLRRNFIFELGKALHQFGTPAFRLEAHLLNVCHSLGLDGYFIVAPTVLTIVLWEPGSSEKHNYHVRMKPGDLDLGSLALADQLVDEVVSGELEVEEATEHLIGIYNSPPPFGERMTFMAFGLTSGAFAMLIGLSWINVGVALLTGLVVYALMQWVLLTNKDTEALEPLVATGSALFASAMGHFYAGINVPLVVLSGIIVFIPGLSITMALKDLTARHMASGTSRLMDGLMCMCKLYFGSVLGTSIADLLWSQHEATDVVAHTMPQWAIWLSIPLLSFTLVVVFKNRIKDMPWGILSAIVAYIGSMSGAMYLGDNVGPFVGALAVGIYSNIFSRITNSPSLVVLLHGVVLLVPGSKAYLGLNQLVSGEVMLDLPEIGTQAFMIFMSILAGLIFSNMVCPSRKTL